MPVHFVALAITTGGSQFAANVALKCGDRLCAKTVSSQKARQRPRRPRVDVSVSPLIKYHDFIAVLGMDLGDAGALHAAGVDDARVEPPAGPVTHRSDAAGGVLVKDGELPGPPLGSAGEHRRRNT